MRGLWLSQGLTGLCETGMSNTSPQGWVYGVSRQALTEAKTGEIHRQTKPEPQRLPLPPRIHPKMLLTTLSRQINLSLPLGKALALLGGIFVHTLGAGHPALIMR